MVRKLVKKLSACVLAAAVVAGLTGCGSVTSGKRIVRISHAQSETHPEHLGLLAFKKYVEERLGDKYEVQIFPNELLGSAQKAIELTQTGAIDFVVAGTANLETFASVYEIFSMPYLFDSVEDADAMLDGEAGEMLKDILSEYGLHCMGIAENGFRELTNSKHAVATVADVAGLKIRTMENKFHQELWNSLGATATPMSSSELYTALEQGTVDGEENPVANFYSYQFQEVQKYITMSNHIYSPFLFDMSKKIWDTYDADTQAILTEAAKALGEEEKKINRQAAADNLQSCIDDYGMEVTYLTDDAKAEFVAKTAHIQDMIAKDTGAEIMDLLAAAKG